MYQTLWNTQISLRCDRDHILLRYLGYFQKLKTFLDYFCIFPLSSFEDNNNLHVLV